MEGFMNIPTDVQRQVLLRAPYISHDELKDVCKSWKEMMCSPRFYEDRKTYGTSQHLICLIQDIPSLFFFGITVYDPVEKTSERTAPIPYDLTYWSFVSLNGPPFVLFWRFFSVNAKLVQRMAPRSRHVHWLNLFRLCSFFFERTYLRGWWSRARELSGYCGSIRCGTLYLILSKEVMEYDAQKNVWTPVTSVPGVITLVFCAAAWRDRIFVNGVTEEGNPISYFFQPSTGKWSEVEHQEFAPYSPAYFAVTSLEI